MVLCEISCEFFGGFTTEIDLNYMDSKKDICEQVKRTLMTTLQMNNFAALVDIAEKITFHIHDFEFGEILMMQNNQKIWICNHSPHCDENTENENTTKASQSTEENVAEC
tara:strand:- start:239 stop:568 length:330 start_codon:yes stop_codon:yes gene_type:complete